MNAMGRPRPFLSGSPRKGQASPTEGNGSRVTIRPWTASEREPRACSLRSLIRLHPGLQRLNSYR